MIALLSRGFVELEAKRDFYKNLKIESGKVSVYSTEGVYEPPQLPAAIKVSLYVLLGTILGALLGSVIVVFCRLFIYYKNLCVLNS